MKDTIYILCTTDDNYASHCGIMLTSLFETNKDSKFCVYLLTDTLNQNHRERFSLLSQQYRSEINIIKVDASQWDGLSLSASYLSLASCYRLLAPNLLPGKVHRILYLDCDIIINGDIKPLWNCDLDGKGIGVIRDINPAHSKLTIDDFYFNSGVLLCDLDYWREHNVTEQCNQLIANETEILFYIDQDALNIVYNKSKKQLPLTYNYQIGFLKKYCLALYSKETQKDLKSFAFSPVVVHFMTPHKPWIKYGIYPPYTRLYLKFKRKSPWKNTPLQEITMTNKQKRDWRWNLLLRWICIKHQPNQYFESINDIFLREENSFRVLKFAFLEAISRKEPELFWDAFRVRRGQLFK